MTTSSLCGKPDDYESRKSWTNKDWYTHVGAWVNEHGQLCFGSTMAFCAMLEQFHKTHTQDAKGLLAALEDLYEAYGKAVTAEDWDAETTRAAAAAIAKATGAL